MEFLIAVAGGGGEAQEMWKGSEYLFKYLFK